MKMSPDTAGDDYYSLLSVREAIPEKNLFSYGHCPKGGGVFGQSKLVETVFFLLRKWLKKKHVFLSTFCG